MERKQLLNQKTDNRADSEKDNLPEEKQTNEHDSSLKEESPLEGTPTNETVKEDNNSEQETKVEETEAKAKIAESNMQEQTNFDSNPPLLITEISPNSEGGGTDYYEFFELNNNTNQPLSLMNYSFVYRYTNTGEDLVFQVPPVTLEPQETVVLWFNNGNLTLQDFNANQV
ncbi:lamin tail domain-containing protein [Oceanobacillus senegalensis]|uniref:lamin tail domain-containing protein n=1 Tax=Oceanobacillus senegalensis TaxID=1936063 RepID=UPI0015C4610E|nr:lamin tail domain-containing protein [Oceanobacillus senegalensis]